MKKNLLVYTALLMFIFTASCDGQKQTNPPADTVAQSNQAENLSEFDPYFAGTVIENSPNGPDVITRNIIQDRKGNFWLATWDGIIRYDGETFTNFTNKEGLRRFRVFAILEDKIGNIWFGTIGAGVYHFDGANFTNFTVKDGLPNDKVTGIYEDEKGDIWFCTMGGVSRFDGQTFHNLTTNEGLCDDDVNSVIEDKNGKFWVGTRGSACLFEENLFTELTNESGRSFQNVRCIIKAKNGNIWFGGNAGLWTFDGESFTNFAKEFVGYIYEDKDGNIWTSSEGGVTGDWVLTKYDFGLFPSKKTTVTRLQPNMGMLFGITEDSEGNIWVGSVKGVCRYDGKTFKYF